MAPAAWRVCMRQTFTMAVPAEVAMELAVAGAGARRSVRLFLVDNDTSQARQHLLFCFIQKRKAGKQGS